MAAKIKNPWGDKRDASVLDSKCCARRCLHVGEDKGVFTQGRGYTRYYKNPQLVCMARHLHGCPHPLPEPDPEKIRCCRIPKFPKPRGKPYKQRCKSCGAWASGWQLGELAHLELVECKHLRVGETTDDIFPDAWSCPDCGLRWVGKKKPEAFEPGLTFSEFWDKRFPPRKGLTTKGCVKAFVEELADLDLPETPSLIVSQSLKDIRPDDEVFEEFGKDGC